VSPLDPTLPGGLMGVASLQGGPDLEALKRGAGPDAQRAAALALEQTFFAQLLDAMRKTIPDSGLFPRSAMRTTYEGMFDRTISEKLAESDPLGLVARLAPEEVGHEGR
jgi:Rod binding domain-containing protein